MTLVYILLKVIFWLCALALVHTYVIFPLLLRLLSIGKKNNTNTFSRGDDLPAISILIAAYNEETVIREKLESILNSDYPKEKTEVYIGSDNSSDRTNEIVRGYEQTNSNIHLVNFGQRTGKVMIVNKLEKLASGSILVLTDANVIFAPDTLFELVKHFKEPAIGLVDSNMTNTGMKKGGISVPEKTYIRGEVAVKNAEGKIWGAMMGPFGGCYAIRKSLYSEVPSNFLVDDFYINMRTLEKGSKCISETRALVFEEVSNDLKEEFRRKVRIATGNFQNLSTFARLLGRFNGLSFCFFSHKVLRWIGPLFMVIAFATSAALMDFPNFYFWVFLLSLVLPGLVLADLILKKQGAHVALLRFITHFLSMNLALLVGMIRYMSGVKSSVWEPTRRNQK
jgi:cellulose synthase/poly-beta-1,6-N-acetylglucosamine synthase-like glycosyltransferase